MILKKKTVTTTTEEITVSIDDRKVLVYSETDKEKETETAETLVKAVERVLDLNSKKQ